ncbi:TetR/AcrR family transcriptional regulator [Frankia sp. AgKG'84/4]|uniref:TetR/AcrR family transcriptional regulator n=1 Tax=Frankia sp. AgKG'84/4 TaxID=573490 RepID=UPI00200FCFDB|nr:TetR/AcrR family transcriptional regulator [Frankia sp. AgKG'84/4]MCL9796543.1 TetR/AcrR family transcriptional regulator [Frankia sp. AgKG'84/4]
MARSSAPSTAGSGGTAAPGGDLRSRTRRALQAEIMAVAFDLFDQQGFEATTINQIAERAGLSRSSFFRYFATKEDVVLLGIEERGLRLHDALAARPADEAPWQALRQALRLVAAEGAANPDRTLRLSHMMAITPSLQARQLQRVHGWQRLLTPELARRLGPAAAGAVDPRPDALASAALGCYQAAMTAWRESDGHADLPALLDQAMNALVS